MMAPAAACRAGSQPGKQINSHVRYWSAPLPAACQCLRIISFTVTQLPAPNYHCRLGKDTAVREWPEHWWQHIVVDVGRQVGAPGSPACWARGELLGKPVRCLLGAGRRGIGGGCESAALDRQLALVPCDSWLVIMHMYTQATHGCGDLIFSSHTTFVLVGCLTYTEYGSLLFMKVRASEAAPQQLPLLRKAALLKGASRCPCLHALGFVDHTCHGRRCHACMRLAVLCCASGPWDPTCALQIVGWLGVAAMSLCIVMSRKHYSVDVVVAWYTVPLMFYAMHRRWTTKRPVQDYWPHRPLLVRRGWAVRASGWVEAEAGPGRSSCQWAGWGGLCTVSQVADSLVPAVSAWEHWLGQCGAERAACAVQGEEAVELQALDVEDEEDGRGDAVSNSAPAVGRVCSRGAGQELVVWQDFFCYTACSRAGTTMNACHIQTSPRLRALWPCKCDGFARLQWLCTFARALHDCKLLQQHRTPPPALPAVRQATAAAGGGA